MLKGSFMDNLFHNSIEEYFSIEGEAKFEFYSGLMHIKGGLPVVLLGGIVEKPEEAYIIMINNASRDEVKKVAQFVSEMRKNNK
jgi:hypothetical protein